MAAEKNRARPHCDVKPRTVPVIRPDLEPGRASAIRLIRAKWVNGTVLHYYFLPSDKWSWEKEQTDVVKWAFKTWKDLDIGLKFVETTDVTEADRLGNGNTLLSLWYSIVEIDRNNNVVWNYDDNHRMLSSAFDADRLPNGNTLITAWICEGVTCNSRVPSVREVSPGGDTVWEYRIFNGFPKDADRLPNGTTLIVDDYEVYNPGGRAFVVNSAGQMLWQYTTPDWPRDVDAIPDAYILP